MKMDREIQSESTGALRGNQNERRVHILAGKAGQSLINKLYSCFNNDKRHQAPLHGCEISDTDVVFFFSICSFPTTFFPLETSTRLSGLVKSADNQGRKA